MLHNSSVKGTVMLQVGEGKTHDRKQIRCCAPWRRIAARCAYTWSQYNRKPSTNPQTTCTPDATSTSLCMAVISTWQRTVTASLSSTGCCSFRWSCASEAWSSGMCVMCLTARRKVRRHHHAIAIRMVSQSCPSVGWMGNVTCIQGELGCLRNDIRMIDDMFEEISSNACPSAGLWRQ